MLWCKDKIVRSSEFTCLISVSFLNGSERGTTGFTMLISAKTAFMGGKLQSRGRFSEALISSWMAVTYPDFSKSPSHVGGGCNLENFKG